MQNIKDLVFFDKNGFPYNFNYDEAENLWTGSIYIEPVSKGLFETQKIIVMQKYIMKTETIYDVQSGSDTFPDFSNSVNTYEYGYPSSFYGLDPTDRYEFEWDDSVKEVDEIQMFGFDRSVCPPEDTSALTYNEYNCPEIVFIPKVEIGNLVMNPVDCIGGDEFPFGDDKTKLVISYEKNGNWSSSHADIDICFCNMDDEYSTFRRDLFMYYSDPDSTLGSTENSNRTLVGVFSVYAKSIEEDERLTTMCRNLGYDINNVDFSIFQDSDIKENLIDNELMNEKRKEILMEGHNIYSYIGSYKSLINAIRFFGYDNITIKEWWKNVDISSENYGKHFMASSYSLENHEVIHSDSNVKLPSKKYRKTGKLTLAYRINDLIKEDGNGYVPAQSSYPGHDYPETNENFTYTIEEAVIKLYGLKRKLEKEFLPITTRIIDIVGEADAFYANVIRTKPSQNTCFGSISGPKNDFSVLGSNDGCFYIEDLRPFGIHAEELPHGDGIVGNIRNGNASYIGGGYKSLYDADTGTDVVEFGNETIGDYNTNFDNLNDGHELTGSTDFQGYSQDWDLNTLANIDMTGSMSEIEDIEGTGSCETGSSYTGPTGVIPPYELDNGSLFAVLGETYNGCKPWMYYVQANENNTGNYYIAEFSNYYPNLANNAMQANEFDDDFNTHLPDNENIPVGALVELKIDETDWKWDMFNCCWEDIQGMEWQYANLYCDNISRVEWVLHKDEDKNPGFDVTIGGMITHGYNDIGIVLPYVGSYDVTMRLYDWNNNVKLNRKSGCINVCPKEVEFAGWCRMKTKTVGWDADRNWESLSCIWDFPFANHYTWNDMKSATFDGMDRGAFLGQYAGTDDVDESVIVYNFAEDVYGNVPYLTENNRGPYFWDNLDVAWQDMDHLWWNAMNITGDIPCYFEFGYFDQSGNPAVSPEGNDEGYDDRLPGTWLEIVDKNNNYASFRFPSSSSSGLNYVADVARQLNETIDPILGSFHYSYIWDYNSSHSGNLNIPQGFRIMAVSKNHGKTGDVKHVGIVSSAYHAYTDMNNVLHVRKDPENSQLVFHTNSVECNPNWNDVVCINNITNVPAYTDVNFNYSNCRIWGKKNPVWTFRNLNDGTVFTSTKRNYHRMFKNKGCWEVTLKLNDTNGNVYERTRNMFITY